MKLVQLGGTASYTTAPGLVPWRVAAIGIDNHAAGERSVLMTLPLWLLYLLMLPGMALRLMVGPVCDVPMVETCRGREPFPMTDAVRLALSILFLALTLCLMRQLT